MAHSDATIDVQCRKKTDTREIRATIKYKMDDPNRQINTWKSVKKTSLNEISNQRKCKSILHLTNSHE